MNKVRCAVIGAGWWGTTAHVPALVRHPRCDLVAVQHRDPEKARQTARDFGIRNACSELEEVLAIDGLDAVVISSTANVHYRQAKAALELGLHVLLEKPMTINAAEAAELVEIAERQSLQFLLSAPWHYTPHAAEAQRLVRSGELGDIRMISMLMADSQWGLYQGLPWQECFGDAPNLECELHPYREPERTSYSDPSIAGGGQIYTQVSHPAAYLSFLTGWRPNEVFARFDNAGAPVDVFDTLCLSVGPGVLVSLAAAGATGLNERSMDVRVFGMKAELNMELFTGRMRVRGIDGSERRYDDLPANECYPFYEPAKNLVDAVLGDAPNRSPAIHGWHAMEVIDASVRSAASGRNIVVGSKTREKETAHHA